MARRKKRARRFGHPSEQHAAYAEGRISATQRDAGEVERAAARGQCGKAFDKIRSMEHHAGQFEAHDFSTSSRNVRGGDLLGKVTRDAYNAFNKACKVTKKARRSRR